MGILDCAIGNQRGRKAVFEGFGRLLLPVGPQCLLHPAIQKGKLAFGVKPVLTAFQYGQVCVVGLCKAGDRLQRGQMVMLCV